MKQRGRKSSSHLATVAPVEPIPRQAPPGDLTDYEAAIWTAVVNSKPADWFDASTLPLLLSYCKHVSHAADLDQEIADFNPKWIRDEQKPNAVSMYKFLLDAREKETRAITALARSMRLTQQSQIHPATAGVAAQKKSGKKLWESE